MKRIIVFMLAISTLFACVACQPTPEKPPVVSKNDGTLEKEIYEGAPEGWELEYPSVYSYHEDMEDGFYNSDADEIPVTAPQTSGFPVYRGYSDGIEPDMLLHIIDAACGSREAYGHTGVMTKDQLTAQYLIPMKQRLFQMENDEIDFSLYIDGEDFSTVEQVKKKMISMQKQQIKEIEKEIAAAPETVDVQSYDLSKYKQGDSISVDVIKPDGAKVHVKVTRKGKLLRMAFDDTSLSDYGENMINTSSGYADKAEGCTLEEGRELAQSFMDSLGLSDEFENTFVSAQSFENTFNSYDEYKPVIHTGYVFTRQIGGMSVNPYGAPSDTWGPSEFVGLEDKYASLGKTDLYNESFLYEDIIVWVRNGQITGFTWKGILKTELVQENVKLTDFQTAADRGMHCAMLFWVSPYARDYSDKREFIAENYELSYAQIREKNADSFLLVPAWFLYGREVFTDKDGTRNGTNKSIYPDAIVNAIDGSNIERLLGY